MKIEIMRKFYSIVSINFTNTSVIICYMQDGAVKSMSYSEQEFANKMAVGEIITTCAGM